MTKPRDERVLARFKAGHWLIRRGLNWNWTNGAFEVISGRGVHQATIDRLIDAGLLELSPDRLEARLPKEVPKGG